jgi:membrane dipeptidase
MKLKDVSIIWIPWILNSVLLCSPQEYEIARQARNLHFSSLILDTHVDTTPKLLTEWKFTEEHHAGHVDLPRMLKGGLNALFFSIWIPGETRGPQAVNDALIRIAAVHKLAEDSPDKISLCVTADQVRQARRQGKIAALIGMEGGHMLNNNLSILRMYSLLGVRYLTLTHSVNADWADSSGDKAAHNGLTPLGKEIIQELNREGIIVDISHSSDKTFWDALEVSKAPLIASHSSCRALCSHPRNMTGNMIKALAAKGGVIQINYHVEFLDDRAAEYFKKAEPVMRELAAEYVQKGKLEDLRQEITRRFGPPPSISWERIVDHIDHAVKLVGAAHVGLGSDFDGAQMPEGMEDVSQLPKITEALVRKGYPSSEIKMILGENLLRVLTDVERAARTMRGH